MAAAVAVSQCVPGPTRPLTGLGCRHPASSMFTEAERGQVGNEGTSRNQGREVGYLETPASDGAVIIAKTYEMTSLGERLQGEGGTRREEGPSARPQGQLCKS